MKKPVLIAAVLFVLDQLTKYLITVFIPYQGSVKVIPVFDFFNLTNLRNTGVAFSFFQGKNFLFSVFVSLVLVFFCVWLYKNRNSVSKMQFYAFCLVISGGLGNLADRIFRGAVVDFLDFGVNALRWPSFNIADSCICVGAFLIILDIIKPVFKKKKA